MGFYGYVIKRALSTIPVIIGITVIVFLLMKLTPGSPVDVLLPPEFRSPEAVESVRRRLGLDKPLHIQYGTWLFNAIQGDLGSSIRSRRAVTDILPSRIFATAQLGFVAITISLFIAIPAGILSAVYKDTWVDNLGRIFAFLGISIPNFWMGIMIILVFSLFWREWFGSVLIPSGGYATPSDGLGTWLRHILPPGITLGVAFSAITTRLTRSAMVEVLNEDYIRTARSKGVKELTIVFVHGFRNALIPVVTVFGMQIGYIMNGSIVVEQVFRWPGLGSLLFEAVTGRDLAVIQAIVLIVAITFAISNLLVDISYSYLDPRIKYSDDK